MYIDLGNHNIVKQEKILAMIDVKSFRASYMNAEFFEEAKRRGKLIFCTDESFVKSYVILEDNPEVDAHPTIYATSFTAKAIAEKRNLV